MDTARDYRILVAEDALERIERIIREWRLPYQVSKDRAAGILRELRARLLRLKYSYLPSKLIVETDEMRELMGLAGELRGVLMPKRVPTGLTPKQKLRIAEIRYSLAVLLGLRARLLLGDANDPRNAVDVFGFRVAAVEPHPELGKLRVTRAVARDVALTVVTNIVGIKPGEVRGVAILPPVLFGSVVSEGMYSTPRLGEEWVGRRVGGDRVSNDVVNFVYGVARR